MFSNNSSKPSVCFKNKINYNNAFPATPPDKLYDLWYSRPYYGKINTKGITVYPKEKFLTAIDDKGQFKALNFVSDAFRDLKSFMDRAKERKVFSLDFLGDFSPKKAWKSLPVEYDKYFNDFIFNPFLNSYLVDKTVKNFDSFVKEYLRFARMVAPDVSITQNEFILSNNCTNKISGLIVDLSNDDHGDNKNKVEKYLDTFEYASFVDPCRDFGFRINKNAPWQLIADLTNPKMISYQQPVRQRQHKVSSIPDLFESYYYTASEIDFENFKKYLYILYSSHYSVNSTYQKVKVSLGSIKYGSPLFSDYETTLVKELPVETIPKTFQEFKEKYGEEYFLKLYFRIRLIENDQESDYDSLVKNISAYYNLGDTKRVLNYIDLKLINSKIYTKDDPTPYFFD